jgi:hypothetical protein
MRLFRFYAFGAALGALAGCGSRTGLLVADEPPAGVDAGDATVPVDAGLDAVPDVSPDQSVDAPLDAPPDVVDAAADVVDAAPDVTVDAHPVPIGCEEAGAASTLIYLITVQSDLWSFYPPSLEFHKIGPINCPTIPGPIPPTPFSMAVNESGIAYVVYSDGELFRLSTADARCTSTSFQTGQEGFAKTFGMGYSHNASGAGEMLYVASDEDAGVVSRLGYIDTSSFALHTVGFFPPSIVTAELTGTGAGDLYAFYSLSPGFQGVSGPPSAIALIDKANGNLIGTPISLENIGQGCAWAFAFWGGDFYTFTAPPVAGSCPKTGMSIVSRMNPSDGSIVSPYATLGEQIVGAGVSTCAPQE